MITERVALKRARFWELSKLIYINFERFPVKSLRIPTPSSNISKIGAAVLIAFSACSLSNLASANHTMQSNSIDGTLSIEVEDYAGHSQLKYWIKDHQGKRTEILLEKQPHWLKTGQKLRVHGYPQGKKFAVEEQSISLLQSSETSSSTTTTSSTSSTISGVRSVLVAEVNFAVNPIVRYSTAEIDDLVLNQASQFLQETSYNMVSLTGEVAEPITIDVDVASCNTSALSDLADEEFRQRGYEPNSYDHVMYVIPTHPKCTWSGKGNVGGPRSWIKRFQAGTVNHELGHNLGLYHSNKKDCGSVTTGGSCTVSEYGDYLSAMSGTSTAKHFNGFHKEQLGWLDSKLAILTDSGSVTLSALETSETSAPKVLKIAKGVDGSGNNEWYYIEYRQAQGFDSSLATEAPSYLDGVRLREGTDNQPNSSNLLDPTPNSTSYDWDDISLAPGQSYSQDDITISVLASDASQVVLDVQFGEGTTPLPAQCNTQTAIFEALSSSNISAEAGDQVTFNYRLTNNDSQECASTVFNMANTLSNGLSGDFDITEFSLNPGQIQTVSLTVAVPATAQDGNYNVSSSAVRSDDGQSVSQSASINVTSTESNNSAPIAVDDLVIITSKTSVTIDVLVNDYDLDSDNLVITATTQGNKGTVTLNSDDTLTYAPAKSFKSTDSFSYTISDGTLSHTASVSISLQSSGGSDDGGTGGGGKGKGGKK